MDISYNELKSKEIINLADGKKLGHVVDVLFDSVNGRVSGIVVPGEKRMFRRNEEIFIPLEKVRKIGDDVVLIRFEIQPAYSQNPYGQAVMAQNAIYSSNNSQGRSNNDSYIRFRRLSNNKYK